MASQLGGWKRSHYCTQVADVEIGQTVTVMGWVQKRRNLGGLVFIDLRDRTGIVQLVVDAERAGQAAFDTAAEARSEYVMAFIGQVSQRVGSQVNDGLKTGHVEILVDQLKVLSESAVLPYNLDDPRTSDALKYKYRYLGLRQPAMQRNLHIRHEVCRVVREYLNEQGFTEIETPMLCRSTPEGARDYLVPSRVAPGNFYALPQSPQIYKQLLMVSGCDRYYQIARCFRDEDLRADRQPEFTQIDMEMSFVTAEDVMAIAENMLNRVITTVIGTDPGPWPRMTYRDAMDQYGSDKPDIRFGMQLITVNQVFADSTLAFLATPANQGRVAAICVPGGAEMTRKEIDALGEVARTYRAGGLAWVAMTEPARGSIIKALDGDRLARLQQATGANPGDLVLLVADNDPAVASTALGQVRLAVGQKLGLCDPAVFRPLWVTEFPFFEYDRESGEYLAMHHPFTMPHEDDLPLLDGGDFGAIRAQAYDMVINGVEIASGSIRIHDTALQEKMFRLLGFDREAAWNRFGFLLEAFQYGTPPHGGIAPGLDRLVMLLCQCDSIRDVIAFPKMQNAHDLMSGSPNVVDPQQLKDLGLAILPKEAEQAAE